MLKNCKFHHIGYAVRSITETAAFYTCAGWELSDIQIDPEQNTYIAFLTREGFPLMELVAPVDNNSPINDTLKKMGVTSYHICYEVPNIDEAIRDLRLKRFMLLFKPVNAIALGNKKIGYLMHPSVGLIELVEK